MKKTKTHFVKFRVTKSELLLIKYKAKKAGISTSDLIRSLALGYEISYKLNQEEIEIYKELAKFSDNFRRISNLFKAGDVTAVKEQSIKTGLEIREHLKKLK